MSRAPLNFRQADVTRAVKGLTKAGVDIVRIRRVEIDQSGKIIIITADASAAHDGKEILTPLDEWMAKHGSHQT